MTTVDFQYIEFLTDDFSIWQHSVGLEIDREHGYALDDAARALLVALQYSHLELAARYLHFLEKACCEYPHAVNFFDAQRQPVNRPPSPDAMGESYWAVAQCIKRGFRIEQAQKIAHSLKNTLEEARFIRTQAYALLGAVDIDTPFARELAEKIYNAYTHHATPTWQWPEKSITYGNAIIPLALLTAYQTLRIEKYRLPALHMLNFLNEVCMYEKMPIAIGNEEWYQRDHPKSLYSQQPIDPAYQVMANMKAYEIELNQEYKNEAELYLSWFWGNNIANTTLIDSKRNRCFDGIDRQKVSVNAGAESTVCYLLAQYAHVA